MDADMARKILVDVRVRYRMGYGSSDKRYDMDGYFVRRDTILMDKRERRNKLREFAQEYITNGKNALIKMMEKPGMDGEWLREPIAGNALEMSIAVAQEVVMREHKAHLIRIGGVHTCCAADYELNETSPESFGDIYAYEKADAWIIDPWANIACLFKNYHDELHTKLVLWGHAAKEVQYESQWLHPFRDFHVPLLHNGSVDIMPWQWGQRTKSARNTASANF